MELNLSLPGNPTRYQPNVLRSIFGYDNLISPAIQVEIATLRVLAEIGVIPEADMVLLTPEIEQKLLEITTTQVDKVEREVTKHDIRALVQIMQGIVPVPLRRWIHVPLTSYDVLDTARTLQFVRAHAEIKKLVHEIMIQLIGKINVGHVPQIGRTHGQHAVPITVGFWFATLLNRVLVGIESMNAAADNLVGKISGPVGAYNAQVGLGIAARCGEKSFEHRVLEKLGLKPGRISTQIVQPEPLSDYLYACVKMSAVFGQLGRDARHLMRTEIGELSEPFESGQVGSSTMAHKRNPINFEGLEGAWLKNQAEFLKVLSCLISEHQRDLVGSSVARDFPTIIVNLATQLGILLRGGEKPFIQRIQVDGESCARNLAMLGDVILAEPIYLALQMAGYPGDAHKLVNHKAMPRTKERGGISLLEATRIALFGVEELEESEAHRIWGNIPPETLQLLSSPASYIGNAGLKAKEVIAAANAYLVDEMPVEE